jgi:hypothetical protein
MAPRREVGSTADVREENTRYWRENSRKPDNTGVNDSHASSNLAEAREPFLVWSLTSALGDGGLRRLPYFVSCLLLPCSRWTFLLTF